jgi:hypothetical protein
LEAWVGIDEQVVQLEPGEQTAKAFGQLPRHTSRSTRVISPA